MKRLFTRENGFLGLSLSFAAIFGWGFFQKAGFPPTQIEANWPSLTVFLLFLILPFAKKLDFFQFLSFEAKIDEVRREVGDAKQKVSDIRDDVRYIMAQQNNLSASLQANNKLSNTLNFYDRPRREEFDAAARSLSDVVPNEETATDTLSGPTAEEKLLKAIFGENRNLSDSAGNTGPSLSELFTDLDTVNMLRKIRLSENVAILRVRIERELRRLVKPLKVDVNRAHNQSIRSLTNIAMKYYPNQLGDQFESFNVFFKIANAAVHSEDVPPEDLDTAIFLGERLLALLQSIPTVPEH
ncbi:hypothetical protein [Agrobacterium cavarae]|uniref:hypothetical protein n=1 Tax=Agrobacterium cavarae TaxID=2528239 RepID=UPI003FD09FF6